MTMTASQGTAPEQVTQALVDFTLRGAFPEEAVSSLKIGPQVLGPAIEALAEAKSKLQVRPQVPKEPLLKTLF